jgi:hypothetical protein
MKGKWYQLIMVLFYTIYKTYTICIINLNPQVIWIIVVGAGANPFTNTNNCSIADSWIRIVVYGVMTHSLWNMFCTIYVLCTMQYMHCAIYVFYLSMYYVVITNITTITTMQQRQNLQQIADKEKSKLSNLFCKV